MQDESALAARACFDAMLQGEGFKATNLLLQKIAGSPQLTSDQRAEINRGIKLFDAFPDQWPLGSFRLSARGGDATLEISFDQDSMDIEIWTGHSWLIEFHFDRELCTASTCDADIVTYITYVENEIFESTYDSVEI